MREHTRGTDGGDRDGSEGTSHGASRRTFLRSGLAAGVLGMGIGSALVGTRVDALSPPAAPIDLQIARLSHGAVTIEWSGTAQQYQVTVQWGEFEWTTTTGDAELTIERPLFQPERSFEVEVRAGDPDVVLSVGRTIELPARPVRDEAPAPPTDLGVEEARETALDLAWTTPESTVDRYEVHHARLDGRAVAGEIASTETSEAAATLSELSDGESYRVWVSAVDGEGRASPAATLTATTSGDATAPTAPANLRVVSFTNGSLTLGWDAATDEGGSGLAHYRVDWTETRDAAETPSTNFDSKRVSADQTETTIDDIRREERYKIRVRAVDGGGNASDWTWLRTVPPRVPEIDGSRPTDPDEDGRFEDVNGNGEADFGDVTALFENLDADAVADNPQLFDFNGNGELDFEDVVALFERI